MKKALLTLSLIPALCCAENTTEVYKSDMTSWEKINAGKGNNWIDWNDAEDDGTYAPMTSSEKELSGCSNGILCEYASDDANAWAISEGIPLTVGQEYEIGIFVRDFGYYSFGEASAENWKLTVSTKSSVSDMDTGIALIYETNFNDQDLKKYTAKFTPETDGSYYFGLNCYSSVDDDYYGIGATGFTITTNSTTAAALITTDSNATPRYFNTQGIEITNPTDGQLYIVKEGNKIYKTILK